MELVSEILKNNENGIHTACVFLDLSKAFDTLNPAILLDKMQNYGIRGIANSWFTSYLSKRRLRVRCGTDKDPEMSYSSSCDVESDTPQGSCLGPLLFLIFTNDLHRNLENCHAILFADDTMINKGHRNKNYLRWCIESDLMKLTEWFRADKLTVNISKTVFMSFGTKNGKLESIELSGETIHHSENTKSLPSVHYTKPRSNQGMLVHPSKMAASGSVSLTEELFQVTRLNQYGDSIQAIHPGDGISEKMFPTSVHGAKFELDNRLT